jgi:hypothetical protein
MSVPFTNFVVYAPHGRFGFDLSSCNPEQPVFFDQVHRDLKHVSGTLEHGSEAAYPACSYNLEPTEPDKNPIRLVVWRLASDGQFTGDTAVLYGYFDEPSAEGLEFYVNQEQSMEQFAPGTAGVGCTIEGRSEPRITLR